MLRVKICLIFIELLLLFIANGCTLEEFSQKPPVQQSYQSDADIEFQKGIDRPPTARTLYTMAEILAAQGKLAECESVLNKCIQDYPEFVPAYNSLAELFMRQGRIKEAIQVLSVAVNTKTADPVVINNLGMCWLIRGDYEKALDMFTKASGMAPERKKYRANMAAALGLLQRDAEALALYEQILSKDVAEHNLKVLKEARQIHINQLPEINE